MSRAPAGAARRAGAPVLVLGLVAVLGVWLWAWSVLPADGVVHHLGGEGVTRVGSRGGLLWPVLLLVALLLALRWVVARLAASRPEALNHPYKDYWLAPERRAAFVRRTVDELDLLWGATLLLLAVALAEVVGVSLDRGWPSVMWPALAGYAVFLGWWAWWLLRRARPPRGGAP